MALFSDVDGGTWFLTALTVCVCLLVLGYRWPNRPVGLNRAHGLLLSLAGFCVFLAYDAYCPDADQPHIRVTGAIVPVKQYTYNSGKSQHTGVLGYMFNSQPKTLLEFDYMATYRLGLMKEPVYGTVTYLGRSENPDVGDGRYRLAHPVVEVDRWPDGERVFYIDTTRHWPRVIVLLTDALLGIMTFFLCWRWSRGEPSDASEEAAKSVQEASTRNELVGLGLGPNR